MKNIVGLTIPALLVFFGIYAVLITVGGSGENVALISDHQIPRGLSLVFGVLGLVGGGSLLASVLSRK